MFYGNGAGGFSSSFTINPVEPVSLCTTDFNGDGWPDLCVGCTNGLYVLTNDTAGGFAGPIVGGTMEFPEDIAAGNLGGGHPSIVLAGETYWYASFLQVLPDPIYGVGNSPSYAINNPGGVGCPEPLVLADLNGDGNLDIVCGVQGGGNNGGFYVTTGNGDGTFTNLQFYPTGMGYSRCWGVDVGDLNGDGHPDVVLADDTGGFEVWLQPPPSSPPTITNVNNATFALGQSNRFTFAARGYPVSTFSESGALPAGVSLSATGILSGVPAATGTFPITVTASNGVPPNAVTNFTLTVLDLRPTLVTPIAFYVKASTATLDVVLTSSGGSPVTQFGFLFAPAAVNPNPTVGGNGVTELDSPNPNSTLYQVQVNSLTPSTQYSLVAFAVNSYGTAYSTVTNFTTSPGPVGSLVVNTLLDVTNTPGLNSLRDAIAYAYELNDVATVTFDPSLFASGPGTLTIANPIFIQGLGGKLTLRGPGPNLLTLSGNDQTQIFNNSGPDVEFDNLTMAHGSSYDGGIIISAYNLSCSNVVFASNRAGNGGAIWSSGPLTLNNCTFTNNLATGNGGAVTCYQWLTISGSTFANNRCGIDANGNTNAYGGLGGAIYAFQSGYPLQMVNSTLVDNHAYNGNGGALELGLGASSIANSTITGNTADGFGGGIDAGYNYSVPINNTIVSGNFAATNADVNDSAGYTATNSLIGADVASIFGGNTLANNGGLTPTIALNPNGPAFNAGNSALIPSGVMTDQRGKVRPQFGTPDIGAYELTAFDTGQTIVTAPDGAYWYLGAPASGNDLSIYREVLGQVPANVGGAAVRIGQANDGSVLVENYNRGVYARIGSTNGIGSYWQLLISVTAGDGATWFLGSDGTGNDFYVYRWATNGVPTFVAGWGTQISTLANGSIAVRNSGGTAYVRVGSNAGVGSSWQIIASTPPTLTGLTPLSNGAFQFSFTNQPGASFRVFTSTNLALPWSNWIWLGAPVENPSGQYQFTDVAATNNQQRFYRVTSP